MDGEMDGMGWVDGWDGLMNGMDGWSGWMEGLDGLMDGLDGWDGWMGWIDGWIDGMDVWMGWMDGWDGGMDGMVGGMNGMDRWVGGYVSLGLMSALIPWLGATFYYYYNSIHHMTKKKKTLCFTSFHSNLNLNVLCTLLVQQCVVRGPEETGVQCRAFAGFGSGRSDGGDTPVR